MTEAQYADLGRAAIAFLIAAKVLKYPPLGDLPPHPADLPKEEEPDWNEISAPVERMAMKFRYHNPKMKASEIAETIRTMFPHRRTTDSSINWYVSKYKKNSNLHKFLRPGERPGAM